MKVFKKNFLNFELLSKYKNNFRKIVWFFGKNAFLTIIILISINGKLSITQSSSVSKEATRQGPAAFFEPLTSISPASSLFPLIINLSNRFAQIQNAKIKNQN